MTEKKHLTIQISEEDHRRLKARAAESGLSLKAAILAGLDKIFPGWRNDKQSTES